MEDVWSKKLPMCRHAAVCCVEWCHFVHHTCYFIFLQDWRCTLDLPICKYCYSVVDQEFHTSDTAFVLVYGLCGIYSGDSRLVETLWSEWKSLQASSSYPCVFQPVTFMAYGRGTLYEVWMQPLWICMSCRDGVQCKVCIKGIVVVTVSAVNGILSENVILWGALCSDQVPGMRHVGGTCLANCKRSVALVLQMYGICHSVAQSWNRNRIY
jgi:hypothetical protein